MAEIAIISKSERYTVASGQLVLQEIIVGGRLIGRTSASGAESWGSSPCPPANTTAVRIKRAAVVVFPLCIFASIQFQKSDDRIERKFWVGHLSTMVCWC